MANKPFDSTLYDTNDDAKHLVVKFLQSQGLEAWINPDQYGIDIIYHDESFIYQYCEVEVKHNWKGALFPFPTVHFPKRKLKFANNDSIFAMLNHERTHALIITGPQFLSAPIVRKDTIYTQNEEFVEINISDCRIVKLEQESDDE